MLACMLLLSACGAPGPVPGLRERGPVGPGAQTPAQSASSTAAAEASGHAEAVALLGLLPAYPRATRIGPSPYGDVSASPEGLAHLPRPGDLPLGPAMGVPASPELIDLYQEWRAPVDPNTVLAWVKQEASQRGLVQTGSGSSSGPKPQDDTEGLAFAQSGGAGLVPGLEVSVQSAGGGQSLVRYDAMVIWTPPRPKGENLPVGVSAVRVQVREGLQERMVKTVTVTDPAQVAHLVSLVAALPLDTRGVTSCPVDMGREVRLTFLGPGQQEVTVSEGTCDSVTFGPLGAFPALTDPGLGLWKAAVTLVGEPSWA